MKYIYLQHYIKEGDSTDYIYIGKHQWPGQGIDPNYKGSCTVVHNGDYLNNPIPNKGWVDGITEMLEDCSNMSSVEYNKRETYWIIKYAEQYGVSMLCPQRCSGGSLNYFVAKYRTSHGRSLNGSCGGGSVGSGEWWLDYYGPYSLSEIENILEVSRTNISSLIHRKGIDFVDSGAQFFYHGHWIHKRLASMRTDAPSVGDALERGVKFARAFKAKHPRYRLQDGFEGDYEQIAAHIHYTGSALFQVERYLRGVRTIPQKWCC